MDESSKNTALIHSTPELSEEEEWESETLELREGFIRNIISVYNKLVEEFLNIKNTSLFFLARYLANESVLVEHLTNGQTTFTVGKNDS